MAQITTGIRSMLSHPVCYNQVQKVFGSGNLFKVLAKEYISPFDGMRLLDVGCGTAKLLDYLPDQTEYVGFDASEQYIKYAQEKYGSRGSFFQKLVSKEALAGMGKFDRIVVKGVLHHLNDDEVVDLFHLARDSMKPGGKLITVDPVWSDEQSSMARWIISKDRGQNVRAEEEYVNIAKAVFPDVRSSIRHGILNIPFSHVFLISSTK